MRKEWGMLIAWLAILLVIGFSNTALVGPVNAFNLTRQIAMLSIFAIGASFVLSSNLAPNSLN